MLRIYIDATKDGETLERILKSIQRQRVNRIETTVIVSEENQFEGLKSKYKFELIINEKNIANTITQLIRKNDKEYFMIMASNQVLGVNMMEEIDALLKEYDGIIFNVSKIRTSGKFCPIYNKNCNSIYDAMSIRPVIQSCIFKTDIVNTNNIVLKSVSLSGQIDFMKRYFKYCQEPCYCSDVLCYIDYLAETTKPSLGYALRGDAYVKGVVKASVNDMLYSTLKNPEVRKTREKMRKKIRKVKRMIRG